ncbi:MAG: beta strand repeat-containing protein, partial [Pyrinomonadaceae bacterium]
MNHGTSILCRRSLRAYAAAFISYVLLVGQCAPLALAAAPKSATPSAPTSTAAPLSAAPAAAPMPLFAPGITATKVDSFPDPNSNGKAEPGDTVTYTVTITNTGSTDATGVTFTDSVDTNTTLVPGSVQTQPIATTDTFTAFGNVRISTTNGAANLLANDCDPDDTTPPCNDNLTASGPTTGPANGQATVNSDGSFSYNPNPGFTGTDSFTYTIRDKGPDGIAGNADDKTDIGTANITVGPTLVWFINNTAAGGGDGRITSPFNSIAAYNASAPTKDPGDIIFIYNGTGTYTGGFTLANTQKVIGQGFSLATETGAAPTGSDPLPAAGSTPTIDNPGLNVITLAQNNTLRGFNTGNTGAAGTDISGTSFGTLTVSNLSVNGDGRALNLTTGTLAATVGGITASNTGANTGLTLNGVGGSLTVSGTTTVTNPGGNGIDITNAPAGASFSFGTATVSKNAAGTAVNLATNNAGATTGFTSLAVTNSSGAGIVTSAGGTLNVTTGSITTTGTGVAASFTNTAIGLTFTSISSNGGANGIIISGGSGSLTSATTNLQNNAGIGLLMSSSAVVAGFGNTTVNSSAGDAVDLSSNTGNITFADLDMTPDAGLRGLDAQNNTGALTVTSGDITTSGGATASAVFIDGPAGRTPINITFNSVTTSGVGDSIHIVDASGTKFQVTGTTQINTRSTTNGGGGVFVDNSTMTNLQFSTTNVPNPSNAGGQAIHIEDTSSAITISTVAISGANQTVAQTDSDNNGVPDSDGDGDGIFLRGNSGSFTLGGGTITNSGGDGIDIRTSANISVSSVTIDTVGLDVSGASVGGVGGHGVAAFDVTGTNSLTGVTITNWETAATNGFRWWNTAAGTGTFTLHGCNFTNSETGSTAIIYRADGTSVMTLNVGGAAGGDPCNFTNIVADAIGHAAGNTAGSTATGNLNVVNNNFTNNLATKGQNSISARNVEGGKATVVISGNTFDGGGRTAADTSGMIDLGADALLAGNQISFSITGNTIKNIGDNITNSCGSLPCTGKRGIDVFIDDNGNVNGTIVIDNNIITNVQRNGIIFDTGSAFNGANYAAKITNNRVGIRADNTIDRVGIGTALSGGGESGIRIENRNSNAKNLNILVSNNLVYNGNGAAGSSLNGSGIFIRAENSATLSATVSSNTVNTNNSSTSNALRADVNFSPSANATLCLDASGNSLNALSGADEIVLSEIQGILNVEQASLAALASANPGSTASILSGSPSFGVTCATPPAAPESFDSDLVQGPGGIATSAPEAAPAVSGNTSDSGVTSRPFVSPTRGTVAPKAVAPKAVAPAAKRDGGTTFHYAAADTSAPLNPVQQPEPAAQRRKVAAPVMTDDPGIPHGAGGTVSVNIGTLVPNDSVTITFQVVIDNPYSGGPNISNQGTVSGSNFSNVLTDDPAVGGGSDPTLTPVNSTDIRVNDASVAEPATGTAQMLFTLTLSQPAPGGGLSVNYATANGGATPATGGAACGGTVDYVTTAGTATVTAGSQTATIPIPVCADTASPESSETFLLNLSSPSSGTIVDGQATGTITQGTTAGTFLISELRTSGPGGLGDDFVEFYNNTNSPLTVASSDASAGYGLYKMGASCNDTPVLIA